MSKKIKRTYLIQKRTDDMIEDIRHQEKKNGNEMFKGEVLDFLIMKIYSLRYSNE